jgi:hypothetical protein
MQSSEVADAPGSPLLTKKAPSVTVKCSYCSQPLHKGDQYVYIETRMAGERVCWHKECYERDVKPFEGKLRPASKQK